MNRASTLSPAVSSQGLEQQIKLGLVLFYLCGFENGHNAVPGALSEGKSLWNAQPTVGTEASLSLRIPHGCPPDSHRAGSAWDCWAAWIQSMQRASVRVKREIKSPATQKTWLQSQWANHLHNSPRKDGRMGPISFFDSGEKGTHGGRLAAGCGAVWWVHQHSVSHLCSQTSVNAQEAVWGWPRALSDLSCYMCLPTI